MSADGDGFLGTFLNFFPNEMDQPCGVLPPRSWPVTMMGLFAWQALLQTLRAFGIAVDQDSYPPCLLFLIEKIRPLHLVVFIIRTFPVIWRVISCAQSLDRPDDE